MSLKKTLQAAVATLALVAAAAMRPVQTRNGVQSAATFTHWTLFVAASIATFPGAAFTHEFPIDTAQGES